MPAIEVAGLLGVSTKSAYQWRQAGLGRRRRPSLASKPRSRPDPKLSDEQLARLTTRLEQGPAVAGCGEAANRPVAAVSVAGGKGAAQGHHRGAQRRSAASEGDPLRISVAGPCCYQPGQLSRLIYRTCSTAAAKASPKGSAIRLPDAAHQQTQDFREALGERRPEHGCTSTNCPGREGLSPPSPTRPSEVAPGGRLTPGAAWTFARASWFDGGQDIAPNILVGTDQPVTGRPYRLWPAGKSLPGRRPRTHRRTYVCL